MSRLEQIAIVIGIALDVVLIADNVFPNIAVLSAILANIPLEARWFIFGASSICFILAIVFQVRGSKVFHKASPEMPVSSLDRNFDHLSIHHFSDVPKPGLLRYVTENRKKQAYRVPDFLEVYVQQHKINWFHHDSENELRRYVTSKYTFNEGDPLPEWLGLKRKNGSLVLAEDRYSELVSKLKGRKLEDLQIVFLERRRFFSSPARRRLLIKLSAKQAFQSPSCDFELMENGIVDSEHKGMWFFDNCKKWCKRNGYAFVDRRYPESELLVYRS